MAPNGGVLKYDAAGFDNHVSQLKKIEGDVEQLLGQLHQQILSMPDFWAGGSQTSAAAAAEKIKQAGDLVREAIGSHGISVAKAHQLFQEGDQAVQGYFAKQ